MGKARNERGAQPDGFIEARRSLSFWWTFFRVLAVVSAALSVLTLNRGGEVFAWDPPIGGLINSFADFLDVVVWPVEWAINWLIAQLGWSLKMGPLFKPMLLISMALIGANIRVYVREGKGVFTPYLIIAFFVYFFWAFFGGLISVDMEQDAWVFFIGSISTLGAIGLLEFGLGLNLKSPRRSQTARAVGFEIFSILVVMLVVIAVNYLRLSS